MIKINKNLKEIPTSLQSDNAEKLLLEHCEAEKYIDKTKYNKVYAADDVKQKLEEIYNNKCAYCESKISGGHIEHFRDKRDYYWLAYSWDNLLLSCEKCNQHKSSKFDLQDESKRIKFNKKDLSKRHNLSSEYNNTEQPLFIHPEFENPESLLTFTKNGEVSSNNNRMQYTLNKCKINRRILKNNRLKILKDFTKSIETEIDEHGKIGVSALLRDFKRKAKDNSQSFSAFRRYCISNILPDILKSIFQ